MQLDVEDVEDEIERELKEVGFGGAHMNFSSYKFF